MCLVCYMTMSINSIKDIYYSIEDVPISPKKKAEKMDMINRAENKIAYFPDGFRYCYIYHTRQSGVVTSQEPQK